MCTDSTKVPSGVGDPTLECNAVGNARVNEPFQAEHVFTIELADSNIVCDAWKKCAGPSGDETCDADNDMVKTHPSRFYYEGIATICYYDSLLSECGSSDGAIERVCCCTTVGGDPESECHVPTTTSTSSSVTVTETSATITSTTSSTATSTSSTASTTGTETGTTVTATSTSMTTSSATATQTTTETATTSTTTLGRTQLTDALSPGDEFLVLDESEVFRVDDLIYIGETEIVTIIAIVVSGGRRLSDTANARQLSVTSIQVSPPVVGNWPAGTSIRNLGSASVYYAGSDPITFYGGKKYKFWLPPQTEVLMLETSDVRLYGAVFAGPEKDQQWFDSFRVVLPDGSNVAKIGVKRDGNLTASTDCSHKQFESLSVELGKSFLPLQTLDTLKLSATETVKLEVNCRLQDPPLLWNTRTEYMYFETSQLCFAITASHAGNEFPENRTKAVEFSHLDFVIMDMKGHTTFSGILPEIWEVKPRSDAVKVMLSPDGQYLDLSKNSTSTITV